MQWQYNCFITIHWSTLTCGCEGQSHSYFYCVYLRDSCVVMSAVIRTHSKSNLCQQWSTPGTCRLKLSVSRQSVQQVTVMFSIYFLLNRIVIMWGKYLCFQGLKWQLLTVPSIPYIWFMVQVIFLQCHQHQPWTRTNWRPPVLKWSPGVRSLLFTSVWRTWSKHGQNVYDLLTWLFSNPLCSMRPVIWQFQNAVQRTQTEFEKWGKKSLLGVSDRGTVLQFPVWTCWRTCLQFNSEHSDVVRMVDMAEGVKTPLDDPAVSKSFSPPYIFYTL